MVIEVITMTKRAVNGKITGTPKVLKLAPLLLFAKLTTAEGVQLNCLIHQHGLNFLYQATLGAQVAVYGHYNARQQFVIEKFTILSRTTQTAS
ncbi:hypothetical protein [Levilactobacillus sp. HBUAS67488]|uniref:hypothetical protein n=2 Tax=Lactobacillales TaxID=186826 RepID=UPI002FF02928